MKGLGWISALQFSDLFQENAQLASFWNEIFACFGSFFFFFIWQKSATKCDCFTDSLDGKQVLSVRNGAAVAAKVILCAEQFE